MPSASRRRSSSPTTSIASSSPSRSARTGTAARQIILEPVGRNTAPAACIAALALAAEDPDALLLVMPSDHAIADAAAFQAAIERAAGAARAGALVTFGIAADRPETGYGYIKRGAALGGQRRLLRRRRLRREARPQARRDLSRVRRLFLEQRHLPVPGAALPRRARPACSPTWSPAAAAALDKGAARSRFPAPRQGGLRRPARASRSTMR